MYRGYFPIIPNQNSHKECFEIGQWDSTKENYDSPLQKFIEDPANWPDFKDDSGGMNSQSKGFYCGSET